MDVTSPDSEASPRTTEALSDKRILELREIVKKNIPSPSRLDREAVLAPLGIMFGHKYNYWYENIEAVNKEICDSKRLTAPETKLVYLGLYIKLMQQDWNKTGSLGTIAPIVYDWIPDDLKEEDKIKYQEWTRTLFQLGSNVGSIFMNPNFNPEALKRTLEIETEKAKGLRIQGHDYNEVLEIDIHATTTPPPEELK